MIRTLIGGLAIAASLLVPLVYGLSAVSPDSAAQNKRVSARALPAASTTP